MIIVTPDLSDGFFVKVKALSKKLGCDSVYSLLGVMFYESGCSATARNKFTNACGLIQFMPEVLKNLGWHEGDYFQLLTAEEQLPYVEKYFTGKKLPTLLHVYTAVFMPAELVNADKPETVLTAKMGKRSWAYDVNKSLDRNGDGSVTIGELGDTVKAACVGSRWNEIVARTGLPVPWKASDVIGSVAWVQEKLKLEADGVLGPRTTNSLLQFQRVNKLTLTGRLNKETLECLMKR